MPPSKPEYPKGRIAIVCRRCLRRFSSSCAGRVECNCGPGQEQHAVTRVYNGKLESCREGTALG